MPDVAEIAKSLTEAQREAMAFFDVCDLPEAENEAEVALIGELMKIGLVGHVIANGRHFMDCRPLGLAVRNYLENSRGN